MYRYNVNLYLDEDQMILPAQLRMARAAIRWGVRELVAKAGVTANTVTRIENGADAKQSTMERLQRTLEDAGIEFTNGERPGVRLSQAAATRMREADRAPKPGIAVKKKKISKTPRHNTIETRRREAQVRGVIRRT
jgi:transcriptional regulator with XRE-family HTH domain